MDDLRPLPCREYAFVEDDKLGYYLEQFRRGGPGSKVGLFRDVLGFTDPELLRQALVGHAQAHAATLFVRTRWGDIWNVDGPLRGPSRTIMMRTGWILALGSRHPRNTTAYPLRRGGRIGSRHGH